MIYKKFQDLELSALGLGCMRLPCIDGKEENPDQAATQEMVDYAMAGGINYYDTAWGYHYGKSESVIGEALSKHDRSKFYLASKFPGYDLSNFAKHEEIFEKQLEKCKVDYFDFYLFHNVFEGNIEKYVNDDRERSLFRAQKAGGGEHPERLHGKGDRPRHGDERADRDQRRSQRGI